VIGVMHGMVGCFGGMSIAAGLCSYLVVLPQARLGLNGPEVIEQEAGIDEIDASDRRLIWSLMGGEQRYETGFRSGACRWRRSRRCLPPARSPLGRSVRAGPVAGPPGSCTARQRSTCRRSNRPFRG